MGSGTGLSAQFGIAPEVTYGTYVAPTGFLPMTADGGESFESDRTYLEIPTLRSDTLVMSEDMTIQTTRQGTGSLPLPLYRKGMGKLFNLLHGNTVTPVQQAATIAYLQTHAVGLVGPPANRSATFQFGRDTVDGTTRVFSYVGSKCSGAKFSCAVGEELKSEWEFDVRDEDVGQTLGVATYPSSNIPLVFTQGVIEVDDAVLTDCVKGFDLDIGLELATDRFCLDSTGLKKAPLCTGVTIEGSLELEFTSMTQHTAFTAGSNRKLELLFTGSIITGAYPYKCDFVIPSMKTTKVAPQASGPGIINYSMPFKAGYNGSLAPLSIAYQSSDTSL